LQGGVHLQQAVVTCQAISVKSLGLIFTPQSCATNCRCSWKSVAVAVEFLNRGGDNIQQMHKCDGRFANRRRHRAYHRQITEIQYQRKLPVLAVSVTIGKFPRQEYGSGLLTASAPKKSGRYRRNVIPIWK